MNKFSLLLCLILVLNYSTQISISDDVIDKYYDYLVEAFKGLSLEGNNECANRFISHKTDLIRIIKSVKKDIEDGEDIVTLAAKYMVDLLTVDSSIITKCNLLGLVPLIKKFDDVDEIKGMGKAISDNAQTILDNIRKVKSAEGLLNKVQYIAKILGIVINFYVY